MFTKLQTYKTSTSFLGLAAVTIACASLSSGCAANSDGYDEGFEGAEPELESASEPVRVSKLVGVYEGISSPDGVRHQRERLTIRADRTFELTTEYSPNNYFNTPRVRTERTWGSWRRPFLTLGGGDIRLKTSDDVPARSQFQTRLLLQGGNLMQVGAYLRGGRLVCADAAGCVRVGEL